MDHRPADARHEDEGHADHVVSNTNGLDIRTLAGTFACGALLGATAALLLAPARGHDTRQRLRQATREGVGRSRAVVGRSRQVLARGVAHAASVAERARTLVNDRQSGSDLGEAASDGSGA